MRLGIFAVVLVCLTLWLPSRAACTELQEREAITLTVATALRQGQYKRLEDLANEYRESEARTSSGLWKLTLFYAGLSKVFDTRRQDEGFWSAVQLSTEKWKAQYPTSPTAHLAYALMLNNRGWSYRGSGMANTVKPEDWKPFAEYSQKARAYLEEHKAVASKDPRWYELMTEIAYQQSWPQDKFNDLMNEGLSRYPYFYQIHFAAIDYLAPKWGGSAAAIENFARKAQERTSKVEGFGMYARIYWYASQTQYSSALFSKSLVDWSMMKKGMDDVLKKYPDEWNSNHFAKFACLAGDRSKTSEMFAFTRGEPLMEAWPDMVYYERCKAWSKGARDGSSLRAGAKAAPSL